MIILQSGDAVCNSSICVILWFDSQPIPIPSNSLSCLMRRHHQYGLFTKHKSVNLIMYFKGSISELVSFLLLKSIRGVIEKRDKSALSIPLPSLGKEGATAVAGVSSCHLGAGWRKHPSRGLHAVLPWHLGSRVPPSLPKRVFISSLRYFNVLFATATIFYIRFYWKTMTH